MQNHKFWLRVIGGLWLTIGIIGTIWGICALLSIPLDRIFSLYLDAQTQALWDILLFSPWAEIVIIVSGVCFIITGWALICRRIWVQTIMVPAHLFFAIASIVGCITIFVSPIGLQRAGLISFSMLVLINIAVALFLNSISFLAATANIAGYPSTV